MKHQIDKTVRALGDVDDFLKITEKFSKKYYTVDLVGGENVKYQLNVRAIAISRDLVCKLKWMMAAESNKVDTISDTPFFTMVRSGDAPIHGWKPSVEKELLKFYPNTGHVPDEPGEHRWITLFECHGFTLEDKITQLD